MNYTMKDGQIKGLQTVHRSIQLLNCFTIDEPEFSLTELCKRIKFPKSTTARIIETLTETEMLERNDHNFKYKLCRTLYILGLIVENSNDIVRLVIPIMQQLREDPGASV